MSYAPDFKVLIVNQLAAGSEFTPGINLTVGTYYWRVQAMGGGDVSWFTVTRSLTIE
jgi:Flp pilus assembly protein protease CpaA